MSAIRGKADIEANVTTDVMIAALSGKRLRLEKKPREHRADRSLCDRKWMGLRLMRDRPPTEITANGFSESAFRLSWSFWVALVANGRGPFLKRTAKQKS
jgi:hypothetical protein